MLNVVRRITKKGNRILSNWTGKSIATAKAYNHWRLKLTNSAAKMKDVFDVEVYSQPFDPKQGCQIYSSDKAEVLLIRLEA